MTKTYARVDQGVVLELVETDGDIAQLFHPALVFADVTGITPVPEEGWRATEAAGVWTFSSPPPAPPPSTAQQILTLEATASPRRLREAALGADGGWLKALDGQIAALRAKLPK